MGVLSTTPILAFSPKQAKDNEEWCWCCISHFWFPFSAFTWGMNLLASGTCSLAWGLNISTIYSVQTPPHLLERFRKLSQKKHQFFTTNVVFITKMFWQLVMFSTSFLCFQIFLKINFHRVLYFKLFMVFVSLFCKQLLEIKWKTIKICFKKHMFPFFKKKKLFFVF